MTAVDHLFILLLFVGQPIYGWYSYRQFVRKVNAGTPANRVAVYANTFGGEWLALSALLASWLYFERDLAELGFVAISGNGFYISLALVVVVALILLRSWRTTKGFDREERAKQRSDMGDLVHFLPHNKEELKEFCALSLTAGVVEEIIYRGFALWYLSTFMPMWAAVLVSAIAFGFGHSYQGPLGVLRVTVVGIAFGALYVVSGSLWLPIVAHALFDVLQGLIIVNVLDDSSGEDASPLAPGGVA